MENRSAIEAPSHFLVFAIDRILQRTHRENAFDAKRHLRDTTRAGRPSQLAAVDRDDVCIGRQDGSLFAILFQLVDFRLKGGRPAQQDLLAGNV